MHLGKKKNAATKHQYKIKSNMKDKMGFDGSKKIAVCNAIIEFNLFVNETRCHRVNNYVILIIITNQRFNKVAVGGFAKLW